MKNLLFLFVFSSQLFANPLKQMESQQKTFDETTIKCAPVPGLSDHGFSAEVSCEFKCVNGKETQVERVEDDFIPEAQGLSAGNGSNQKNIMWGSLGVSLKLWSEKICLEKAQGHCKSFTNIDMSRLKKIASGSWSLTSFPGCKDSSITLSPFDDSAGTKRIEKSVGGISSFLSPGLLSFNESLDHFDIGNLNVPHAKIDATENCKTIVKADLCFGDCLDMSRKSSEGIVETLGTADPLGKSTMEICADKLVQALEGKKVSQSMRSQLCERYFWDSFLKTSHSGYSSCAATRGEVHCQNF